MKIIEISEVKKALSDAMDSWVKQADLSLLEMMAIEVVKILPDKPEPITEEQHYKRGYQKGYHEGYQKALDENGILSGEDAERFIRKMKEVNDGKNT